MGDTVSAADALAVAELLGLLPILREEVLEAVPLLVKLPLPELLTVSAAV